MTTCPYVTALADLRTRRDQLDLAITALEAVVRDWPVEAPKKRGNKPYADMTDVELANELDRLETAQAAATGWGAAVGVRDEYIKDVLGEQSRRKDRAVRCVPRFADPPNTPPLVFDKNGRRLKVGDYCTWCTTGYPAIDVVVIELRHRDMAQVSIGGEHRALANGADLRYDETRSNKPQPYTLGHEETDQ